MDRRDFLKLFLERRVNLKQEISTDQYQYEKQKLFNSGIVLAVTSG